MQNMNLIERIVLFVLFKKLLIKSVTNLCTKMSQTNKESNIVTGAEAPTKKDTLGTMPSMKNPMTNQNMGVQS